MNAWVQCPGCRFWKTGIVGLCGDCRKAQDLSTANRKPQDEPGR